MSKFDSDFLTVRELASRYRVTQKTIGNLRRQGKIPAPLKIGRSARWLRSEIESWEQTLKVGELA